MSVWPVPHRELPSLITAEGALVAVEIAVQPSLLEDLLETLARVPLPNQSGDISHPIRSE